MRSNYYLHNLSYTSMGVVIPNLSVEDGAVYPVWETLLNSPSGETQIHYSIPTTFLLLLGLDDVQFSFIFATTWKYTGCRRRNGQNFGRVFLMLNYTDITQNTYIQSWTVTEIMALEKCGLLGCPRTVRRPWRHIHPLRMPGNETPLANVAMQWSWRDYASAAVCVNYLET